MYTDKLNENLNCTKECKNLDFINTNRILNEYNTKFNQPSVG